MFYSRQPRKAPQKRGDSLLRFLVMAVVALGFALYFFVTDAGYDRAGVMLAAAVLCGGNVLWKARHFENVEAAKQKVLDRLREVLR